MATPNLTVTIVAWKYIPVMLEAQWEFVAFNPNVNAFRSQGDGSAVLSKQGWAETRAKDGLEKGLLPKRGELEDDDVAPLCTQATIPNAGTIIRIIFNEPVIIGPSGARGFKITGGVSPIRIKFQSVLDGSPNILIYTLDRTVIKTESGILLSYTQPIGGVQDVAGNDVGTFNDLSVTNSSNQ